MVISPSAGSQRGTRIRELRITNLTRLPLDCFLLAVSMENNPRMLYYSFTLHGQISTCT